MLPTISNTHFIFKFYFCFHYIVIFLCRKYWLRFTTKYSPEVFLFSIKVLPNCFHTGLIFIYLFTFFFLGGGVFRCKKFPSPFEQNTWFVNLWLTIFISASSWFDVRCPVFLDLREVCWEEKFNGKLLTVVECQQCKLAFSQLFIGLVIVLERDR